MANIGPILEGAMQGYQMGSQIRDRREQRARQGLMDQRQLEIDAENQRRYDAQTAEQSRIRALNETRQQEQDSLASEARDRQAEEFGWKKEDRAAAQKKEKFNQAMNRMTSAYQLAATGDSETALQVLNEGVPEDKQFTGVDVNQDTGDFTIIHPDFQEVKTFKQMAPFLPSYQKMMNSRTGSKFLPGADKGLSANATKADVASAMTQFNERFNLDEVSKKNPDGLSKATRTVVMKALPEKLMAGENFKDIADELGLSPREEILPVKAQGLMADAKASAAAADSAGNPFWAGVNGVNDSVYRDVPAKARALSDMRHQIEKERAAQPQSWVPPDSSPMAPKPVQGGLSATIQDSLAKTFPDMDSNQDGKIDENDQAYVAAKLMMDTLNSKDEKKIAVLKQRFGPAKIAQAQAFANAYEKKAKLDAEAQVGIQR